MLEEGYLPTLQNGGNVIILHVKLYSHTQDLRPGADLYLNKQTETQKGKVTDPRSGPKCLFLLTVPGITSWHSECHVPYTHLQTLKVHLYFKQNMAL